MPRKKDFVFNLKCEEMLIHLIFPKRSCRITKLFFKQSDFSVVSWTWKTPMFSVPSGMYIMGNLISAGKSIF